MENRCYLFISKNNNNNVIVSPSTYLTSFIFYFYVLMLPDTFSLIPIKDFLFPRFLPSTYSPDRRLAHPLPPVDAGHPLFPPVQHLSFHSPVTTCPDNYVKAVITGKPSQMPPLGPTMALKLPPAGGLQNQQPQRTQPPAGPGQKLQTALKHPARWQVISVINAPQITPNTHTDSE